MADVMGGIKGAAGGAAIGSTFGPIGTAVGGGLGLLGGLFGDQNDEQKRQLELYRQQLLNRQAPQAGAASQAGLSDFRGNQQNLISRLEALSRGEGPSAAGEMLKQATDSNLAQQSSIAQSGRGNAALANIVAANNAQNFGQAAAGQAAAARTNEQLGAFNQLGGAVQQGRQGDEQTSQFNALQQNYRDQANLEAKLRTMGLNDEAILRIMGQLNQVNQQPTMGDQLLAGGGGALGMLAANRGKPQGMSGGGVSAGPNGLINPYQA